MISSEAKDLAELWLAKKLSEATGIVFTANKGGETADDDAEEEVPKPAMGIGQIKVTDCQSILHGQKVFQMVVAIGFMTHMGDATAPQHRVGARKVEDALFALIPGYDATLGICVNGVDVRNIEDFTDEEEKTRGDAWFLTMGVSE